MNIDSYIEVKNGTATVDKIGLSAGMDTINTDDLLKYIFCASYNKIIHGVIPRTENVSMNTYKESIPFDFSLNDPNVIINVGGYDNNPDGMYMGVIWLYTDIFANHPENNNNLSHFKVVMSWDAPNYFCTIPVPNGKRDNVTTWSYSDVSKCFATTGTIQNLNYDYNGTAIPVNDIYPFMVFKTNDGSNDYLFISALRQNANTFRCRPFTKGTQTRYIGTTTLKAYQTGGQTFSPVGAKLKTYGKTLPYSWNMGASAGQASANPNAYGDTEMTNLFAYTEGGGNSGDTIGCMTWTWFLNTKHESLLFWAANGLKFTAGTTKYKPIIQNGVVTGYSTNMDAKSDLDKWSGTTQHNIPISPTSSGDDEIEMPLTDHQSLNGFVMYYKIDRATADDLSDALSAFDISLIGKDLLPNLISYKLFAVADGNVNVGAYRQIRIGGHPMKKSNDDPIKGYPLLPAGISPISLGRIRIPKSFNDFRDFAPYTKIEIYVPFCGWATLPPWCMGYTISGEMFIDYANGTVKAVIKASETVVAEMGGCCAIDIPFSSVSTGTKTANILSNLASGATSAFNPTPQNLISGSLGILTAFNANYTQIKGVMGDGSNLDGLTAVYVKITRPPTIDNNGNDIATIPDSYKHERGIPCGRSLTLQQGDGFTQVMDANIQGDMTAREKQMIIDGLRHGLIL